MVFLKPPFNFTKENKKLSLFSLKLTQMSLQHKELFQNAFDIKIKKIKVTNMASIKMHTHIIH